MGQPHMQTRLIRAFLSRNVSKLPEDFGFTGKWRSLEHQAELAIFSLVN